MMFYLEKIKSTTNDWEQCTGNNCPEQCTKRLEPFKNTLGKKNRDFG